MVLRDGICVRITVPYHCKLDADSVLPQMTRRHFGCNSRSPLMLRTAVSSITKAHWRLPALAFFLHAGRGGGKQHGKSCGDS